jgi:chromosome segregation ATPase
MQGDLNSMHEKFSGSLEQHKILNDEIERLNIRIKQQTNELRDCHCRIDDQDSKLREQEKLIKQYEYEIETDKQIIFNNDNTIQNLKAEWTANIRNHEEEIKSFKYHCNVLNEELSTGKVDLSEAHTKIVELKQQILTLTDSFDFVNDENKMNLQRISKYETLMGEQETKILNYSTEVGMLQHQLEKSNGQLQNINSKLSEIEIRYEQAQKAYEKSEAHTRSLNETTMEMKFKVKLLPISNELLTRLSMIDFVDIRLQKRIRPSNI